MRPTGWGAGALLAAVCALFCGPAASAVLFRAPFDGTLAPEGMAGYRAPAAEGLSFHPARIGDGVFVPKGAGPLVYAGGAGDIRRRGSVSFWMGSGGVRGDDPAAVNLVSLRLAGCAFSVYKGADGFLYAAHEVPSMLKDEQKRTVRTVHRYPLYDLLPTYPGTPDSYDVRHYIVLQWGGPGFGLSVNGLRGWVADPADAPPPPLEPKDGEILIGDAAAGLHFDEVSVADAVRDGEELADEAAAGLNGARRPAPPVVAVAARTGPPVVVDGDATDEEWSAASMAAGFHAEPSLRLEPGGPRVLFAYDGEKFYAALRAPAPAGEPAAGLFFLFLRPFDDPALGCFHFAGDAAGGFSDRAGNDPAWNGAWEYASRAAGGVWTAELAIPYASMVTGPFRAECPASGALWRFGAGCARTGDPPGASGLSFGDGCGDLRRAGRMAFENGGVSPRLERVAVGKDAVVFAFRLVNTGWRPRRLEVSATAAAGPAPFAEARESVDVPAGGSGERTIRLPLAGRAEALLEWRATDRESGRCLLRGSAMAPGPSAGSGVAPAPAAETAGTVHSPPDVRPPASDARTDVRLRVLRERAGLSPGDDSLFRPNGVAAGPAAVPVPGGFAVVRRVPETGRVFLAVGSSGGEDAPMEVPVDIARGPRALPAGPLRLVDLYTGQTIRADGTRIAVPVGRNDVRLFEISGTGP